MVEAVSILRERAENDEANVLYSLVNDLSKVSQYISLVNTCTLVESGHIRMKKALKCKPLAQYD